MSDFQPTPPNRPKTNVWKWVAIGCGSITLLGIALITTLVYFGMRQLQFSMDPEEVEAKASQIFDYELPGGSTGLMSMNMFGMDIMQITDTQDPPTVLLTVATLPANVQDDMQEQFLESFQQGLNDQNAQNFNFETERMEERSLCGQTVSVQVQEGEAVIQGQTPQPALSYLTHVSYNDTQRIAWILAMGDRATETADVVFNSLQCK